MGETAPRWDGGFSEAFAEGSSPPQPLDEWVRDHRIIVGGARPGRWDPRNAPSVVEPMRAFSDRRVQRIVLVAPTQLCKSELAVSCAVYEAAHGYDVLFYEPDELLLRKFMGDRIRPALRALGARGIRAVEHEGGLKKKDSAIELRHAGGGMITGLTPGYRTGRAGHTARLVVYDERDLMAAPDLEQVALSRLTTYGADGKQVILGTPTIDAEGTVWRGWLGGSRGVWRGRCEHCGELSGMEWRQVRFEEDKDGLWIPEGAAMYCSECKAPWTEPERRQAILRGAYVHEEPDHPYRTFRIPGPAHLWRSIEQIVAAGAETWRAAQKEHEWVPYERWTNEYRAEPWEEEYLGLSSRRLADGLYSLGVRGVDTMGELDPRALLLTWGADVGAHSIHAEWVAWGWDPKTERILSWGLRYKVFGGRLEDSTETPDLWVLVREALEKTVFRHPAGERPVGVMKGLIDTRWKPEIVRSWCEEQMREEAKRRRVSLTRLGHFGATILPWVSKSVEGTGPTIDLRSGLNSPEKRKRAPAVVSGSVSLIKDAMYESLQLDQRLKEDPANRLPKDAEDRGYTEEWRKEMASELPVIVRTRSGHPKREWQSKKGQAKNEAWDCRIYARAAAMMLAGRRSLPDLLRGMAARAARSPATGASPEGEGKIVQFPRSPASAPADDH